MTARKTVVLARDWPSARTVMREFGEHPNHVIWADSPEKLKGLRDVSFLYANNWHEHPKAAEIQLEVALIASRAEAPDARSMTPDNETRK